MKMHVNQKNAVTDTNDIFDLGALLRGLTNDPDAHIDGCDVSIYLEMLDDIDASDNDKKELIHTLWSVIETIILTQFKMDSASLIHNQKQQKLAQDSAPMLQSSQRPNHFQNNQRHTFNENVGLKEGVE